MNKRTFWILLIALCLLPVLAMADDARTMKPLPKEMVTYSLPEGLALTKSSHKDGQISLTIDVENTDWPLVLLDDGGFSDIGMNCLIRVPEGADYVSERNGNGFTEEALSNIDFWSGSEEWHDYGRAVNNLMEQDGVRYLNAGSILAGWIQEINSVRLDDSADNWYILLRWYDQVDTDQEGRAVCEPIATHKLKISRGATQKGIIPAGKPLTISDDKRIIVDATNALSHVKYQVENGTITLTPQNQNASCRDNQMIVLVEFPQGAVAWSDSKDGWHYSIAEKNGKKYAEWYAWTEDLGNSNARQSRAFWFFDEAGNVVEKFSLKLLNNPMPGAKPSEEYMRQVTGGVLTDGENWKMDWQKVPQKNMKITSVIPPSVYKVNYANGMLTTSLSGQGKDLINFSENGETIDIIAPAGAKTYRMNNSGDAFWGPMQAWLYHERHYTVVDGDVFPVLNGKARVWDSGDVLTAIPVAGSDLTLYMPVQYNGGNDFYKQTLMIYFYDVLNPSWDTKPIAQWYYNRMDDDDFFLTATTASYRSEAQIPANQNDPCIVDPLGRDFRLLIRYYLQDGKNARHYELTVVDENGNPIKLKKGEGVYVYLPYMAKTDTKYWVHHFGNDLYTAENAKYDMIEVVNTPKGLRFYTESFSPFVLNWEGEEPVQTAPPKTGDSMPLELMGLLAVLSLAALTVLIRQRRHS